MRFNTNSNTNNSNILDWSFMDYSNNNNEVQLQEPVAFDDFQFSLGLDPDFALPIPLDMPPPPVLTEEEFLSIEPIPTPINNSVLNENDQKAFSQFLHQFYVDPNMQIDPQFSSIFDGQNQPPLPLQPVNYHPQYHSTHIYNDNNNNNNSSSSSSSNNNDGSCNNEEYFRQSSILQSLDEQKKSFQKEYNDEKPIFLQQMNRVTIPYARAQNKSSLKRDDFEPKIVTGGGAIRRNKPHKELLTEEEKRSNHIASEQKRRGMIRTGFKDLTDIVPTLKNINNSKSTVLFKAVDYIKYLEKRNKNLREKIKNLEVRVEVEGKINSLNRPKDIASSAANGMNTALLQHKTQQRQLMELQEKLQLHRKQQQYDEKKPYYSFNQQPPKKRNNSNLSEVKMEVDSSTTNEPLIKATVSA